MSKTILKDGLAHVAIPFSNASKRHDAGLQIGRKSGVKRGHYVDWRQRLWTLHAQPVSVLGSVHAHLLQLGRKDTQVV